jgi:hypothetical protein
MVQVTTCIEKDTQRKMVTETKGVKDLAGAEGDVCGGVFGGGGGRGSEEPQDKKSEGMHQIKR